MTQMQKKYQTSVAGLMQLSRGRHGSVLLMVVGVLALMAIIAVVYAAIAQADRRGSAAFVRANQLDDQVGLIRDYIAGKIGEDRLSTYEETIPGMMEPLVRRKTWDGPGVPLNAISEGPTGTNQTLFRPVGGAYSPWLSSTEPTRLGPFPPMAAPENDPQRPYLSARDWLSISNIVPDGRFVNLATLRNNFRAEPGTGADGRGKRRTSEGLTLFGPDGRPQLSTGTVQLDNGATADPNVPWHWTMRQVRAFRPASELDPRAMAPDPGRDEYLLNQWADADGDGMIDSRWFELVDGSDVLHIKSLLPYDPKIRYFLAVKAVDQSGKVNLNTGTDFVAAPTVEYPLGISPAEVNLRGLLSLNSAYNRFALAGVPIGYNKIQQPIPAYPGPVNYSLYTKPVADAVGRAGYHALRDSIAQGRMPPPGVTGTFGDYGFVSSQSRVQYYQRIGAEPAGRLIGLGAGVNGTLTYALIGTQSDEELLTFGGANDPRRKSPLETIVDGRSDRTRNLYPWYGVLMSNRPQNVERGGKGNNPLPMQVVDGQADQDALLREFVNVRNQVATHNGASPLTSLPRMASSGSGGLRPNEIGDSEVKVNYRQMLKLPRTQVLTSPDRLNDADRRAFFLAMLDALAPYLYDAENPDPARNTWDPNVASNRSLNYGGSAEFGVRSTIALYLNILDAMDDDNDPDVDEKGPTAVSVPLTRGIDPTTLPYKVLTLTDPNQLSQARTSLRGMMDRVNMFGIEPQPFVAETAYYGLFTDMPPFRVTGVPIRSSPTPDDEFAAATPGPRPGDPVDLQPVTISHLRSANNGDYIGEVLAFQITNPFDRELKLDDGNDDLAALTTGMRYYVEYAGNAYRLGTFDPTARTFGPASLAAGETKVFYALSWEKAQFERRVFAATSGTTNSTPRPTFLDTWLNSQFNPADPANPTGHQDLVEMTMVDPKTGAPITASITAGPVYGVLDFQNDNHTARFQNEVPQANVTEERNLHRSVMLWRVMRTPMLDPTGRSSNLVTNDLMVDRMHDSRTDSNPDSDGPALYVDYGRILDDNVADSHAGDDRSLFPVDNVGLSVTFWGSLRRPNNPVGAQNPVGAMPPWCIEAKFDQSYPLMAAPVIYNKSEFGPRASDADPNPRLLGSVRNYTTGGVMDSRFRKLLLMIDDGNTSLPKQIGKEPRFKDDNPIPLSQSRSTATGNPLKTYAEVAVELALGGRATGDGRPRNPVLFQRTGDLLLPLAIGPYQEPLRGFNAGQNEVERLEAQWVTLSEVLAMCSDYYSPPLADANGGTLPSLYYQVCHEDPSIMPPNLPTRPKLDGGHLVLDDYVPYIESSPTLTNVVFNYGTADRTVGLGIPLALNIFDKFRANSYGSKSQLVEGTPNLNTMSLAVLDSLPLLAPDTDVMSGTFIPWLTTDDAMAIPPRVRLFPVDMTVPNSNPKTWDVSTTLQGYRDKTDLFYRHRADFGALPTGAYSDVRFRDTITVIPDPDPTHYGRRRNTIIDGLREGTGFHSVGEIMAARLRKANKEPIPDDNGIDRLGTDGTAIVGYPGVTSLSMYASATGVYSNTGARDSYDQKLAIANAVAGSASVRSDVFAVWFIVHGYLEADTQGLGSEDPMVPTFARRYLMVLDRSNVVKKGNGSQKGDKPKILLFQEVPT